MSLAASLPVRHPSRVYLTLAPVLALGALTPTPSFTPLILLLATLKLHAVKVIPCRSWSSAANQIVLVSLATGLVHATPSLHALASPSTSIIVLALLSAVTTTISAAAVAAGYYAERAARTHWARAAAFPAIWATTWATVERCSPIGQLATWSPVTDLGGYSWLRQVGGQPAINWVVAAWAVVTSNVVAAWIMSSDAPEDSGFARPPRDEAIISFVDDTPIQAPIPPSVRSTVSPNTRRTLLTVGFLMALAIPSYVISELPPPVSAPDVTPFGVACALPYPQRNGHSTGPPSLKDYVAESRTLQSQAKIILWPESAVRFESPREREEAFKAIQPDIANGTYYGIGFEELIHADSADGVWKAGMRRNGLALLGWEGTVYEYYKRHLVPVAESFSLTPSNEKPSIFTAELPHPKHWTAPAWAPAPNFTRPIDITASICLDFTTAGSFAGLPTRPALVLAPARTWHTGIGRAMWEQAKARAEETGSMVLWCDGGAGGVSGVAGRGMHAFRQAGPGSWAQTVSVPWPYDARRTVFSTAGTSAVLAVAWGVVGMGWMVDALALVGKDGQRSAGRAVVRLPGAVGGVLAYVRTLTRRDRVGEAEPLLG
ncbi:hypothetical protein BD413DRAFT_660717 [Trametes elegans]|nr:hypothetical protein BD413DRAFT_660717 [Trametes elegans]